MARRIAEEQITRHAMAWMRGLRFDIVSFDYPGSGTGTPLHPDPELRTTKNAGVIIPDIVAARQASLLFFENKVRFSRSDVDGLLNLKSGRYSKAISGLLAERDQECLPLVGMALWDVPLNRARLLGVRDEIDFAVVINEGGDVEVLYAPVGLFARPRA